jgi:hypothetical protein
MSAFWYRRMWRDRIHTVKTYYRHPRFALVDLLFACIALFVNPYRLCRQFAQKMGRKEDRIYGIYGETPYSTYEKIVRECGLGPEDTWLEIGSGRGKGCFWLSHFVGCRVIGVERVPFFSACAAFLQRLGRWRHLQFICGLVENISLPSVTFVYLYGDFPPLTLPKQAKILSISEPLAEMRVLKSFWVRYPWGRTRAYLQIQSQNQHG